MSGDVHAQAAQLLNQPPDFGPAGADLFGNFRAADDDDGMAHEQAHDAAEAHVRCFMHGRQAASFRGSGDGGNYKQSLVVSRWSLATEFRMIQPANDSRPTTNDRRLTTALYAGVTRILISTAVDECVSAPTEMKSTPVSAYARTFSRVIPPAHSNGILLDWREQISTALRTFSTLTWSSRIASAPCSNACCSSSRDRTSISIGCRPRRLWMARSRAGTAPPASAM